MKTPSRKWVLALLLALLVLPVVAYWLADNWLESSGGRQMLEQSLSERIGMRVSLQGEFDLMLLPDIGVSGTQLVIGGPEPELEFARSRDFEMSVKLKPLIDEQVLVEWIRMSGGHIYPDRYTQTSSRKSDSAGVGADSSAIPSLPEIEELTIRDFQIILPGKNESRLKVKELTLSQFAENRETPFTLEIENLASVDGELRWDTAQSLVHFGNLELDLEGQVVNGKACLLLQAPVSLHFDLRAGLFDLDAFRENLPLPGTGEGMRDGAGGLPLEIRARFAADELRSGGTVARGVVFGLGDEPVCK